MNYYPNDPNELDWGSMSKREFKRAEMHYELRHEENVQYCGVYIDGKLWRRFGSERSARNVANSLVRKGVNAGIGN
jgi:hypothetical protein